MVLDILFLVNIFFYCRNNQKSVQISITKSDAWWKGYLLLITDMLISVTYAISSIDALKFCIVYINFFVIALFFTYEEQWEDKFYKWLKIGGIFHLTFTFFSVLFPKTATNITSWVLSEEVQQMTIRWMSESHKYAGISGQIGTNGIFFSILIGLFFSELKANYKNKFVYIGLVLSIIGLMLTGKKGLILSCVCSVIIILIISNFDTVKKWIYKYKKACMFGAALLTIVIASLIVVIIKNNLFYTSIASRAILYDQMFNAIIENPIFGHGVQSVSYFTEGGKLGHNIYLQTCTEQGIIGVICLIIAIYIPLKLLVRKVSFENIKLTLNENKRTFFALFTHIFIIIYGIFGNPLYDYNLVLIYFLILASAFSKQLKIIEVEKFLRC